MKGTLDSSEHAIVLSELDTTDQPSANSLDACRLGRRTRKCQKNSRQRMLRLRQRRAEALDHRLQGRSFRDIARTMRVNVATAHSYVVAAMQDTLPLEKREIVLRQELARYDRLYARYSPEAMTGDRAAAKLCLKISSQRERLCGLTQPGSLDAEQEGRSNVARAGSVPSHDFGGAVGAAVVNDHNVVEHREPAGFQHRRLCIFRH
jgi:hypothetical protein